MTARDARDTSSRDLIRTARLAVSMSRKLSERAAVLVYESTRLVRDCESERVGLARRSVVVGLLRE